MGTAAGERLQAAPSGLVTFLFTDVEGSTALWAADPKAMAASLLAHDEVLRAACESRGGYVFTTAGDSFAVAFARASDAVAAAVAAQEGLASVSWPGPALRVRMGLHLGEAEERGGDYFGPVVNLTARLESAGHGGQVLLSEQVRVAASVSGAVDLGVHRLRDVPEPVHVFQLGAGAFPALRIVAPHRTNLPVARTRLVGRLDEFRAVRAALAEHRLVTLTAGGGTGKTRLSLAVGEAELLHRPDGVWFVDLLTVSEPEQVPAAVAAGLGLLLRAGDATGQVADYLEGVDALVILDNCEHLVDAAAALAEAVLDRAGSSVLLATSREFLDVEGERAIRLGSLGAEGNSSAAVELFIERAAALDAAFDGDADRDVIAELCRHLDGLPLAIELAAGRCGAMSPQELLDGLSERFELLGGGRRRRTRRTLEDTLEWSYDLLDEAEQRLFRHLGVFVGAFDADAVAAVTQLPRARCVDLLDSLVAKSLVNAERAGPVMQFRLLETTSAYGERKLVEVGEAEAARDRHLGYHLSVLEPFYRNGAEPDARATEVIVEGADVRAAIMWARREGRWSDLLRLAFGGLGALCDQADDLRSMANTALAELDPDDARSRYLALYLVTGLGVLLDDFVSVAAVVAGADAETDHLCRGWLSCLRVFLTIMSDPAHGLELVEECRPVAAQVDEPVARAELLAELETNRGWMLSRLERHAEAAAAFEAALAGLAPSARATENALWTAVSLTAAQLALGRVDAIPPLGELTRPGRRYLFVAHDFFAALERLVAGDAAGAEAPLRSQASRAAAGRLSREACDSLVLLTMLARLEGDDDLARRLLIESRVPRQPGTIGLAEWLAGELGVRDELEQTRAAVVADRFRSGRAAMEALRVEMARRGWSTT